MVPLAPLRDIITPGPSHARRTRRATRIDVDDARRVSRSTLLGEMATHRWRPLLGVARVQELTSPSSWAPRPSTRQRAFAHAANSLRRCDPADRVSFGAVWTPWPGTPIWCRIGSVCPVGCCRDRTNACQSYPMYRGGRPNAKTWRPMTLASVHTAVSQTRVVLDDLYVHVHVAPVRPRPGRRVGARSVCVPRADIFTMT